MLDHPQAKISKVEDAMDKAVKEFFIDYSAGNFVRNLRSHFFRVRIFSCSAIAIDNNSETASSFGGLWILDPMLWLLKQV